MDAAELRGITRQAATRDHAPLHSGCGRVAGGGIQRVNLFKEEAAFHAEACAAVFTQRRDTDAVGEALTADTLEATSGVVQPLSATLLAVKACIDVLGWTTTAGSRVLARRPTNDAPLVSRLRCLGAVLVGQTNMTEFAYSALGLNPHFGTPLTPLDLLGERIAGGSTSGGAVAIALGLVDLALGTDTSGSVRIPAAFCGVAGFKPSKGRYSREQMVLLSSSFDVPGIMMRTVAACRRVDSLLQRLALKTPAHDLKRLRLVVPQALMREALDPDVGTAFDNTLSTLSRCGVDIIERPLEYLLDIGAIAREGGVIAAEAYAAHRELLSTHLAMFDPRVGLRMLQGAQVRAHDYLESLQRLKRIAERYHADLAEVHGVLTPTVPVLPPKLAELASDDAYFLLNQRVQRFTEVANRIDAPSVSLPAGRPGSDPIGVLLTGHCGSDATLLEVATVIEQALSTTG